jgi:hypothetical protein
MWYIEQFGAVLFAHYLRILAVVSGIQMIGMLVSYQSFLECFLFNILLLKDLSNLLTIQNNLDKYILRVILFLKV